MATKKVVLNNSPILLKDFVGAGGQAEIYRYKDQAIKIYFDQKHCLPAQKITELSKIGGNVIAPVSQVYEENGTLCGYSMRFVKDAVPFCEIFPTSYQTANNIGPSDKARYYLNLLKEVKNVHGANSLIVDLNELNVLFSIQGDIYIIDCDSFQTPSFPATGLMESVRDPKCSIILPNGNKGYNFTANSDWFSFAVLTFQMYSSIHPYKGGHSSYRPNQWRDRMDAGISVFDKGAKLPPACPDLKTIPSTLYDYFYKVFQKGERLEPPTHLNPYDAPKVMPQLVSSTKKFKVETMYVYDSNINFLKHDGQHFYAVTQGRKTYKDGREISHYGETSLLNENLRAQKNTGFFSVIDVGGSALEKPFLTVDKAFYRNGNIYYVEANKLREGNILNFGGKNKFISQPVESLNQDVSSLQVFDGLVIQNLFGRKWLHIPYFPKHCTSKQIPELNDYRILSAKSDKHITVIMTERNGKYTRFIIEHTNNFQTYKIFQQDDVDFGAANVVVTNDGRVVMTTGPDEITLFKNFDQMIQIDNSPVGNNTLYTDGNFIYFTTDNKLYKISLA